MPSPADKKNGEGDLSSPQNTYDWGEIFGDIVNHTSIPPSEIPYMTLPQIDAYRRSVGKHIPIKVYGPNVLSDSNASIQPKPSGPPKVSQFAAFANLFNGI